MSKEFENSFREKFQNFESEVSPDLFDKIVAASNSKRRGAWFFSNRMIWSAAALLLIGLSTILYFTMGDKEQVSNTNNEVANEQLVQEDKQNQEFNNSQIADETDQPTEARSEESSQVELNSDNSGDQSIRTNSINPRDPSTTNNIAQNNRSNPENTLPEDRSSDKDIEIVESTDESGDGLVRDEAPRPKSLEGEDEGNEDKDGPLKETPQDPTLDNPIVSNPPQDGGLDEEPPTPVSPDKNDTKDDPDGPGPSGPKTNFSFDIYVGPGETYRDLLSDNAEWQNARNRAESSLLGVQAGIGINYNLNQDRTWKLSSGIRMTQARIGFNHATTWNTFDTSYTKREITVINPPPIGPTIVTITDTNVTAVPHEDRFKATNTLFSLRIPLELERSFHIGTNWTVLAKAGVTYSFMSQRSGYTLNSAGEIVSQDQLAVNKSSAWNSVWAAGLAYRVNQNVSLLAYPHFNYAFGRTYSQNAGINEREYGIYTHFGIRIDL